MTRRQRLRTQALLLGPWFEPIIKAFDAGASAEDLLAIMLDEFDPYSDDRFARLPEVEYLTGLTRSTIYRQMEAGKFPQAVSLDGGAEAEGAVGWSLPAVRKWMRERTKKNKEFLGSGGKSKLYYLSAPETDQGEPC